MKSEKELLQCLQQGDEEAIRIIFNEFYDELCLYAATILKNFQVAEEVVEDVFIALWKLARNLSITSSLKNYLYKSVYNGCLKYLKNEGKFKISPETFDDAKEKDIFSSSLYVNPESELILKEIEKKAESVMTSLPDQCREIYYLNRYESLSYSQIAEKLKITVGTVKTQMSRAFRKFRKEFGEWLQFL
jgi:RNA polymerase sigma-70 factor (ECF subfamily)